MKEFLTRYSRYNVWANSTLLSVVLQLSPGQQHQEIISSFRSLYKTILHVLNAETAWLQRFHEPVNDAWKGDDFGNDMSRLAAAVNIMDLHWQRFTESIAEESLDDILDYINIRGQAFSHPKNELMHHVFNHSTYHRGQIVTMLRQAGVETIPSTDITTWMRLKN